MKTIDQVTRVRVSAVLIAKLGVVGLLGAAACADTPRRAASLCTPGSTVVCACPGGTAGVQSCLSGGTGFGMCACDGVDGGPMPPPPDGGVDMGPLACGEALLGTGSTHQYVFNVMRLAGPEGDAPPFFSAGFNLDGDDVVACNSHIIGETAEFRSLSDPTERGVDNALGGDIGNLSNGALQDSIDGGARVLLLTVRGVDSFEIDGCVEVVLSNGAYAGASIPLQTPAGRLAPDQEFLAVEDLLRVTAAIVNGVVTVRAARIPIGVDLLGAPLAWPLTNAVASFPIQPESTSGGVLAGVVNSREFVDDVNRIPDLAMYASVIEDTLTGLADIDQNGSPYSCEAGSIAFSMSGVRARIF